MPFLSQPFEEKAPALQSTRIALVMGNKNYRVGALRNPFNDALRVAALLKRLSFEVHCRLDLTLAQMDAALKEFTQACRHYETALIYYAGHGIQVDNINMLVPIDFDLPEKETTGGYSSAVLKSTINLADILEATRSASRTLIFLDACREFPEQRRVAPAVPELWRSLAGRGFAMLDADKERDNLVVSFAADAGKQALDGDRRNSPYTLAFSELAQTPIKIGQLLEDLRHKVFHATDGRQRPREINTLVAPFSLTDNIELDDLVVHATDADDQLFADAVHLDIAEGYRYYLAEYPDGLHAPHAHAALGRLSGNERVRIAAPIVECADPPYFSPGRGLQEWFQDHKDAPQMVVIPALPPALPANGRMGSFAAPSRPFSVSRTPITFAQWIAAAGAGGVDVEPSDNGWGRGNRPVINVSWNAAQEYVAWLNALTQQSYRLLTVAEWEHCCRAQAVGAPPAPARPAQTRSVMPSLPTGTRTVGLEPANELGLYDMLGNVWEWCSDVGSTATYRKAKGGDKGMAGFAFTEEYFAGKGEAYIGFRVAREIRE